MTIRQVTLAMTARFTPPARHLALLLCVIFALVSQHSAFAHPNQVADPAGSSNPNGAAGRLGNVVAQSEDAYIAYDDETKAFEIGTAGISRRMDYDPYGGFRLISVTNKLTGREWLAPGRAGSAELRVEIDGEVISGSDHEFVLQGFKTKKHPNGSIELQVSLVREVAHRHVGEILMHLITGMPVTMHEDLIAHLHYVAFPKTSVVEQWAAIEIANPPADPAGSLAGRGAIPGGNNSGAALRDLTAMDSINMALRPSPETLTLHWVQGLSPEVDMSKPQPDPTLQLRSIQLADGVEQNIGSSARSSQESMGWFALAAPSLREGLFGGIEWSGAWQLSSVRQNGETLLRAGLQGIRHDLKPGEIFEAPRHFMGFYQGDLDEAANASHDLARRYLMRPPPQNFPWTQYNTWFAYYTDLDETKLKREVDLAASLGLEMFYIDAGWYEGSPRDADFSFGLGTWRENREKFPSGLKAFSDYVHSKGLKFGLWVEPERVDLRYAGPGKEVPMEWLAPAALQIVPMEGATETAQICLNHREAREWMKAWLTRLIQDYRVDWLKWDNNIWMSCDPAGQAGDGNYFHILGLYQVLDDLHDRFPNLIIENCASGGNRMDYGLLRRTDIAWLTDETDPSYRVRHHLAGASYPFPPEYLNTWLVESFFERLSDAKEPALLQGLLRSRMMGAFGISLSTEGLNSDQRAVIAAEVKQFKNLRDILVRGNLYRLLPQNEIIVPNLEPPAESDAAEFYDPASQTGVVFLFRGAVPWERRRVMLKGLNPTAMYQVTSADNAIAMRRTGRQLMSQGVNFRYEESHPSTLLFIKPASPGAVPDLTPSPGSR